MIDSVEKKVQHEADKDDINGHADVTRTVFSERIKKTLSAEVGLHFESGKVRTLSMHREWNRSTQPPTSGDFCFRKAGVVFDSFPSLVYDFVNCLDGCVWRMNVSCVRDNIVNGTCKNAKESNHGPDFMLPVQLQRRTNAKMVSLNLLQVMQGAGPAVPYVPCFRLKM